MTKWICKVLIILTITKISFKYWMFPDVAILYWGIVSALIHSWNHYELKCKTVLPVALLLEGAVFSAYMVKHNFLVNENRLLLFLEILSLCIFSLLVLNSFYLLMNWISSKKFFNNINLLKTGIHGKRLSAGIFGFIFLSWLPYFLVYYPGLIMGDSLNSIYQALGLQEWNNHFPVMYSFIIKMCLIPGICLKDLNIGYAFYTLLQMTIISAILAYAVCWLKNKGFSWKIIVLVCMYYAFVSWFPQHAITMWKDGIFSVCLLYSGLQLFDLVISDGKVLQNKRFWKGNIISTIAICFLRNNGVYIIAFICICLTVYDITHKENFKRKLIYLLCNCLIVVMVLVITGPVYEMMGIKKDTVEKYGIPLQQMARTVIEEGNIGEEEYTFLNELLPLEKYKELYSPQLVDPIKWDAAFNKSFFEQNTQRFTASWLKLLFDNPIIYIKAYLDMTFQYWTPNIWENNTYTSNIIWGNLTGAISNPWWEKAEVRYCNILENSQVDTKKIFSITTPMTAVGLLVWFMVLVGMYAVAKKKTAFILALAPCMGNLATLLIATPSGYWPRYMLVIYYMLPLLICMIPMIGKMKNPDKNLYLTAHDNNI